MPKLKPQKLDKDLVNLGAIIDQPFVYQAKHPTKTRMPESQHFEAQSTLIPGGSASGDAAYTYDAENNLTKEVQAASGAIMEFHRREMSCCSPEQLRKA